MIQRSASERFFTGDEHGTLSFYDMSALTATINDLRSKILRSLPMTAELQAGFQLVPDYSYGYSDETSYEGLDLVILYKTPETDAEFNSRYEKEYYELNKEEMDAAKAAAYALWVEKYEKEKAAKLEWKLLDNAAKAQKHRDDQDPVVIARKREERAAKKAQQAREVAQANMGVAQ
jgi:hypothetical protein